MIRISSKSVTVFSSSRSVKRSHCIAAVFSSAAQRRKGHEKGHLLLFKVHIINKINNVNTKTGDIGGCSFTVYIYHV